MLSELDRAVLERLRAPPDRVIFARSLGACPPLLQWQEDVLRCEDQSILLNCSRQAGKSTVSSVLACHTAIYQPGSLILLVSKALRQALNLGKTVRKLMESLPSPPRLEGPPSKLDLRLANGSEIICLPGSEATIRGFSSVSLLIEDEASRVPDALNAAVAPMLAVAQGRHLQLSTPWGKRGHFWKDWDQGGADFKRFKAPWTDCPHIPRGFVERMRRTKGEFWYRQEFCCEFMDTEDQVFAGEVIDRAVKNEVKGMRFV